MKSFSVSNPSFSNSIKIVESTDLVNADNANEAPKQLLQNTVSNNMRINTLEDYTSDIEIQSKIINGTYEGRDLTHIFSQDISYCEDEWEWISNRIRDENFSGIYIGDYIPLTIGNWTYNMQVAGINCYKDNNYIAYKHIDFIGDSCLMSENISVESFRWNDKEGNNNGLEILYYPFHIPPYNISSIKQELSSFYKKLFPYNVKLRIKNKRLFIEHRYGASQILTDSNSCIDTNLGELWIPTEYEVFGSTIWGTKGWSAMGSIQYPLFKYLGLHTRTMIPKEGGPSSSDGWWLATVASGNSTHACRVNESGIADTRSVAEQCALPLCFRIY